MAARFSAKQLAEAVVIWSTRQCGTTVLAEEIEDVESLKSLDLFLSTMSIFSDAFRSLFEPEKDEAQLRPMLSKQTFINYLKPRCSFLAQNDKCFNLVLTCAFVYYELTQTVQHECFHLLRVASKVLTSVLEEKFSDIFTIDLKWEKLITYCKKMHIAVLPSKENRPKEDADDGSNDDLNVANKNPEDEPHVATNYKVFYTDPVTNEVKSEVQKIERNPIDFASLEESESDDESYWCYEQMRRSVILEKITETRHHLEYATELLKALSEKAYRDDFSSDKFDIPISDDEDIEELEKWVEPKPKFEEWKVLMSEEEIEEIRQELCEKKNKDLGDSSANKVRPEDITDKEIFEDFIGILDPEDDEPLCKLCNGKMRSYKTKFIERFCQKYSNSNLVSDKLNLQKRF